MNDDPGANARKYVRTRPNGLYWAAIAALVVMTVLNFPFWLGGAVGPVIAGLPIAFTYHLVYVFAAIAVLWLVFTAIWPRDDDAPSGTTTDDKTEKAG